MARLPQPGGDNGNWGTILNDYLLQIHAPDGTLKENVVTSDAIADNAVSAAAIQDGSITEAQLDTAVQTKLNNAGSAADWDTLANKPAVIAAGADQAAARSAIGAGTSNLAIGTTSVTAKAGDYQPSASDISDSTATGRALLTAANTDDAKGALSLEKADVGLSNVDNTSDATKNSAAAILSNKTISGSSNVLTDIPLGALATTGTADTTTYLRGDGSWQPAPASPGGGLGSLSGFTLGLPGERSYSRSIEIGSARGTDSNPAGSKMNVLAEVWDQPGILKRIWIATGGVWSPSDFGIRGGIIRIYIDDATDPSVEVTMGDFFFVPNNENVYTNQRVGRTVRSDGQASMYRYVHMPYKKYLRVEIESIVTGNNVFYGAADYSTINNFDDIGSQQVSYKIADNRETNQDVRTPLTICDFSGSGQVESIMASFVGDTGDAAILEGNVEVFIDGETMPTWSSSGMEDAFNGGWYTVPVGGYPAGRPGTTSETGERHTLYRFFVDDPIFFTSHLKVVIWAGQSEQASLASSEVELAGSVGYWLNTASTPNYTAVDMTAPTLLDDRFDYTAGSLDPGIWAQDGSRTAMQATGTTIVSAYGSTSADQDVRAVRNDLGLPSDFWVETRVRITDPSHADQEAHVVLLGSHPDAFYGSAVHIQLRRFQEGNWAVAARDDFDTSGFTNIGSGRNLTNQWVRLAAKVEGTAVTAYYSLNDAPSAWVAFAKWTTTKNGPSVGIGTWTAGAEFDYLTIRPLKTVNS